MPGGPRAGSQGLFSAARQCLKGPHVTILSHDPHFRGNSGFQSLGRVCRRVCSPLIGLEHAAAGGHVDAAALAEGAGETCGPEDFLELVARVRWLIRKIHRSG